MFRPGADGAARLGWRDVVAPTATVLSFGVCAAAVFLSPPDRVNALSVILGVGAIGAGVLVAGESGRLAISAAFTVYVLAAALLGPISAIAAPVIAEVAATAVMRTRWRAFAYNTLPAAIVPALVAAVIVRSLTAKPADDVRFYLAVALAGAVALVLNFTMFAGLRRVVFPEEPQY